MSDAQATIQTPTKFPKEAASCLFCGTAPSKTLYEDLPGVVKCLQCGFVYTSPRIGKAAIQALYSREYFESHTSEELGYDNYVSDQALVKKTFIKRLAEIERRWIPTLGKVLDVGCAAGFFLATARERGWQPQGVEISGYCCDYAAKHFDLSLHHGFFENLEEPPASFGLVTMWDYIEHSHTPDKDIEKAFELLAPGGVLALSTPDIGSLPAKIFKHKWIGFKEHEHLYYFNQKNLIQLLQEKGFDVVLSRPIGKYISFDFFAKRLLVYSKILGGFLGWLAKQPLFKNWNFYCNPYDILYIVAQKKQS